MGHWNRIVGKCKRTANIGSHELGERNRNGKGMIEFAQRNNLKIAGTFYKKREKHKWTWKSPSGKVMDKIDLTIVKTVEMQSRFEFASDHKINRCPLQFPEIKG